MGVEKVLVHDEVPVARKVTVVDGPDNVDKLQMNKHSRIIDFYSKLKTKLCNLESRVSIKGDKLQFFFDSKQSNPEMEVSFQRTLRVPMNDGNYPLPPGFGKFPLERVMAHAKKKAIPEDWVKMSGAMMPMYQCEAMWMNFWTGYSSYGNKKPAQGCALQIAAGGKNVLTGEDFSTQHLTKDGYIVTPEQKWLDGVLGGDGVVSQFVASHRGDGVSIESQLRGCDKVGGLQIMCVPKLPIGECMVATSVTDDMICNTTWAKPSSVEVLKQTGDDLGVDTFYLVSRALPGTRKTTEEEKDLMRASGVFPSGIVPATAEEIANERIDTPLKPCVVGREKFNLSSYNICKEAKLHLVLRLRGGGDDTIHHRSNEMAMGTGGNIVQTVYKDEEPDLWDIERATNVFVRLVNSEMWEILTGKNKPYTPICRDVYRRYDFPWYDMYDAPDLSTLHVVPQHLKGLRNVREMSEKLQIDSLQKLWLKDDFDVSAPIVVKQLFNPGKGDIQIPNGALEALFHPTVPTPVDDSASIAPVATASIVMEKKQKQGGCSQACTIM